ncbi:MAG: SDR family NAD(P)-dependent oxidoreductase [Pseudomonadota bacterium]
MENIRRRALVVGASGGIGRAISEELIARGHEVMTLSRSIDGLDITNEESIKRVIGGLDGQFELMVVTTGALVIENYQPEKTLKALDPNALSQQFALNAAGPALLLKHLIPFIPKDHPAVFAALSARVGSISDNRLGGWYAYRASKAALNQLIHTSAIELARSHKQLVCVALHPGTVATSLTSNYRNHPSVTPEEAASNILGVLEHLTPAETGSFIDANGKPIPW